MATLREIKNQARKALHKVLLVPALYLVPTPAGSPSPYEDPIPVNVRVHSKIDLAGSLTGPNTQYSERQETQPKLIFMRNQIDRPARNAVVSVEQGEAYRVDNIEPPDGITVTAKVTRLLVAETVGLPLPDGVAPDGANSGYYTDDTEIGGYATEDE